MTREEERKEAAKTYGITNPVCEIDEYGNFNERDIETPAINFEEGAEWADEHPREGLVSIDKVVDWLRDNFYSYEIADTGYGHVESLNFMNTEVMIEDFLETIKK